jgi:pimeloyl-ACP methyl ester carboxylesterase
MPKPISQHLLGIGALAICLFACRGNASDSAVTVQHDVVFADYSPLSGNLELARRMLSPLNFAQLEHEARRKNVKLREQPVDLANERFALYVPLQAPAAGYALLVFIAPWPAAAVPRNWTAALDRHGMILVTAAHSGNTENVLERRIPLALLAAHNVMQRYPVDKERLYIGGMSGGSRVALRIALAFPDVFHAVLLHSGSDRIGTAQTPLPSAGLFRQFQESMRVVYLTGENDRVNLDTDVESRASMQYWCAFDIGVEPFPFAGHELAGPRDIDLALTALGGHVHPKPDRLAHCRAQREKETGEQLQGVSELLARGKSQDALTLLKSIDVRFAGLAAPQSVELAQKLQVDSPP